MSVVITTYTLASGMMTQGMTWWQAMVTILLGNTIVLIPMILNAHAGTKYGISFPVLCRAAFGMKGANVPALLRAVVACGWFGIQTWIAALALNTLFTAAWPGWTSVPRRHRDRLRALLAAAGRDHRRAASRGSRCSAAMPRRCSSRAARCLLVWGIRHGGGLGHILAESSRLQGADAHGVSFWTIFPPALTAGGGLLGDAEPQHSRLHALRAQPAVAGAGPGARPADDDDGVRVHRRGGDERDDRDLRQGRSGIRSCS